MADNVNDIKDRLTTFLSQEAELAKAEIVPSAKKAGVGSVMFIIALTFVLHALWMFVIALTAVLAWLISLTGLDMLLSVTLGFLAAFLISLIVGGIFAAIGLGKFKKVKAPTATIEEFKATLNAVVDGFTKKDASTMPVERPDLTVVDEKVS